MSIYRTRTIKRQRRTRAEIDQLDRQIVEVLAVRPPTVVHAISRSSLRVAQAVAAAFDIDLAWSLDDLLGDLGTWSATRRFINGHGANPVDQIAEELTGAWGDAAEKKSTYGPLHLRLGHVVGKREKID